MKKLIIMVASLALVAGFAMTAAAADWNFYGSSRISTYWTQSEGDNVGATAGVDQDQFNQDMQGNARIGANVKVSDELTGRFEYGTGVNVRLLYGTWNFGSGALTIGQAYSPLNIFSSGQVFGDDLGLLSFGGVYSGREPLLQLAFGGFKVALVKINDTDDLGATVNYTENNFPAVEASYLYSQDNWNVKIAGGFQTYQDQMNNGAEIDVDSYVVAIGGGVTFDALYIKANIYAGTNSGSLIAIDTGDGWGSAGLAGLTVGANDTDDNDVFGGILAVGAKINDMFSVEAGIGYVEQELDSWTDSDEATAYYLNSTITLAPGVFIVPEIGYFDYDDNNADGINEVKYAGAKWQINF